jgi:hypothetical protein
VLVLQSVGEAVRKDEEIDEVLRVKVREALRCVHEAGFVHGDVARRNFCRTNGGDVFLVDLGRCRASENPWSWRMRCVKWIGYRFLCRTVNCGDIDLSSFQRQVQSKPLLIRLRSYNRPLANDIKRICFAFPTVFQTLGPWIIVREEFRGILTGNCRET